MKNTIIVAAVAVLTVTCLAKPGISVDEKKQHVAEGKKVIMEFAKTLKGHMKGALKSGGPIEAINVCNNIAPTVAADLSKKHGVELGRTSLKLRNSNNAPDSWEKKVLEKFESRKSAGEDVKTMAFADVVVEDGKSYFRMMKAIPTAQKPCLTCHSGKLKAPIAAKLNTLYPDDKARGYKAGDIRGAFSLKKML